MTIDEITRGGVQITVISDNNASLPFTGEHGFSAVIDICGAHTHRILFDTGRGVIFTNAPAAGVNATPHRHRHCKQTAGTKC